MPSIGVVQIGANVPVEKRERLAAVVGQMRRGSSAEKLIRDRVYDLIDRHQEFAGDRDLVMSRVKELIDGNYVYFPIRVEPAIREQFYRVCAGLKTTASIVIRRFIDEIIGDVPAPESTAAPALKSLTGNLDGLLPLPAKRLAAASTRPSVKNPGSATTADKTETDDDLDPGGIPF